MRDRVGVRAETAIALAVLAMVASACVSGGASTQPTAPSPAIETTTPTLDSIPSSTTSVPLTATTLRVLQPGIELIVRTDGGGMDAHNEGYLHFDASAGCVYLTRAASEDEPRYILVWPPGTTATVAPLRVTLPHGTVLAEGDRVGMGGGLYPWPEPAAARLMPALARCASRPTDKVFFVAEDRA